jgi:2-dehydro-3-deoxygluconokinase
MKFVDLLVISEEDGRTVFGARDDSPRDTARSLAQRLNVGAVAITVRDSADGCGAVVAAENSIFSAPRVDVEVVDRVGAGDAFTAGLIASRLEGRDWEQAARFATALAALKLTIPGDFCTASRADVDRLLVQAQSAATR